MQKQNVQTNFDTLFVILRNPCRMWPSQVQLCKFYFSSFCRIYLGITERRTYKRYTRWYVWWLLSHGSNIQHNFISAFLFFIFNFNFRGKILFLFSDCLTFVARMATKKNNRQLIADVRVKCHRHIDLSIRQLFTEFFVFSVFFLHGSILKIGTKLFH